MTAPEWTRLENSAIIYPSCKTRKYSTVFRMSVTMDSDVDPIVLEDALRKVIVRFPSFRYTIRKGLFWWFLQKLENEPSVSSDTSIRPLDISGNGGYMFKLGCTGKRIDLIVYHALTDGAGATTFLLSIAAEYLRLSGKEVPAFGKWVLDPEEEPTLDEMEDCFDRFSGTKGSLDKEEKAWHLEGRDLPEGLLNTIKVSLSTSELKEMAKRLDCTVTEFLSTMLLLSLQDIRRKQRGKRGHIRMELPVNLRPIFGSRTLRNFSSYVYLTLDVTNGDYTFADALKDVKYQKRLYIQTSRLTRRIAANVALEDSFAIRCIPLFIKKPVINLINFLKGDNYATYTFSNLGNIDIPEGMSDYVREMDFTLGRQRRRFGCCSCITLGDCTNLVFSRKIEEDELERAFVSRLRDLGLKVSVQVPFMKGEASFARDARKKAVLSRSYFLPYFLLSI